MVPDRLSRDIGRALEVIIHSKQLSDILIHNHMLPFTRVGAFVRCGLTGDIVFVWDVLASGFPEL